MMTFREYLFENVTNVDYENREDVTRLIQWLCGDLIRYHDLSMKQELKLKEMMSAKDFENWNTETARELFINEWENAEDSEFKNFVLKNMDKILGDDDK